MATLIQSYEQQYSVLTADITAKIGRLKSGNEDNRDQLTREIQANFEEANDLLEQLELESRGAGAGSRVAAYRAELQRVRDEYRSVVNSGGQQYNADNDEVYDDWSGAQEQHRKLLDNTERLERTGRALTDGYRVVLETEQIGAAVLQDLNLQRETIQRSRGRLRETDEQLNRSTRLMNTMIMRALQDRFILIMVFLVLGILLCVGVYFYVT
ncbi:vesicle transport through interaction with t-SNAREs homolog 1A [Helicoverpa armigera]|uniref:vesicle transport through interaction with t-SNAREs homolog 1A n=1 Tax=Helicoverpa armigera TaxID=29058 RepID=UPI000B38DBF2|nr:vesicle transport through interaction with t-SNAREs homolog 1A [Helicoverpa armigera]